MVQDRFPSMLPCRIFLLDVDFPLQIFSTLISLLRFCALLPLPRKESSKMSTSQRYSSRKREKKKQTQSSKRLFFTSPSPLWSPLAAAAFVDVQGSSRLTHSTGRSKGHFHSFTRKKFQWLLKPCNPDMINVYRRQIWFRWRSWVRSSLNWWGREKNFKAEGGKIQLTYGVSSCGRNINEWQYYSTQRQAALGSMETKVGWLPSDLHLHLPLSPTLPQLNLLQEFL